MAFKVLVICAFTLMVQSIAGQCGCRSSGSSSSSSSCRSIEVSNNGGALLITTVGPVVPSGIALATDLGLSGNMDISGTLPYLSAVAFEGQYDTSGTTPITYGCGDCVAITKQIGGSSSYSSSSGCSCGRR